MCKYICVTILYQVTNVVYRGMKMNLKKCNDCHQEISINVDSCPNCGSKKPFKNIKLSLEETKQLNSNEKKNFLKLGGDISYSKLNKFFAITIYGSIGLFIGLLLILNSLPKSEEQIKKEKDELLAAIKVLPANNVEKNYEAYKKLIEAFPQDTQYIEKYNFYKNRFNMAADCQFEAKRNNKKSLSNPSTYEDDLFGGYLTIDWVSPNEYIFQSSFKGKNAFGVEQKLVAKYRCVYNNDGKTKIEQIYLKKALD